MAARDLSGADAVSRADGGALAGVDSRAERRRPTVAPFGSWASSIPISRLTEGVRFFTEPRAADGIRWWLEGRPEERGRQVLVRLDPDGTVTRLTPEGFNARSRVHEYGGGALLVAPDRAGRGDDLVVVSDFATGRLMRVVAPERLVPLTPERQWRFADMTFDPRWGRILAVREDHEPGTIERHGEPENALVAIDPGTGEITVLVEGADFYAAPRPAPDGRSLVWLQWDHPNMPWDGTELWLGEQAFDGIIGRRARIAGSPTDWVSQPRWSPDGDLLFVAEPDGWMNLFRLPAAGVAAASPGAPLGPDALESLAPMPAEFAYPDWNFGFSEHVFLPDGSILAVGRAEGRDRLWRIDPAAGAVAEVPVDWTEISGLAADGWTVVMRVASPTAGTSLVELDFRTGAVRILRSGSSAPSLDPEVVSVGRHVTFPSARGRVAHGIYYAPHNPAVRAPKGELPPLIVTSHGGPTAQAFSGLATSAQLFTSRGFAVLDVDYGGSTGYGRDFRRLLEEEWGIVDVEDCAAGARWLTGQGLADPERMAIRGGSASGYTTLCAITFDDTFRAGTSMYGIGDLSTFVGQTHKFESRYLDRLIGPYPAMAERYRERSPLNFPDRIHCPALILQGAEDRVVPPEQAEQIVDALFERRLPHAYLLFPGEDHGFRGAENIIRAFEAELSFYGQVFGFTPAGPIDPIEVRFLGDAGGHR